MFFSPLYPSLQRHTGRSSPVLLSVPGLPFGKKKRIFIQIIYFLNFNFVDRESWLTVGVGATRIWSAEVLWGEWPTGNKWVALNWTNQINQTNWKESIVPHSVIPWAGADCLVAGCFATGSSAAGWAACVLFIKGDEIMEVVKYNGNHISSHPS